MPVVDAHLHVWRAASNYRDQAATIVSSLSDIPVELAGEYMAEYSVDRAVLVQPRYPGGDNSYVADCAAAQPDRFAAVCVVNPQAADAAACLVYWAGERGCKGLRMRPRLPGEAILFGHSHIYPLWEQARALNLVISVLANAEHLPALAALADRFPEVAIVIDHLAHPDVAAGVNSGAFQSLLALAQYPRVFIKISGYYYYSRQNYPYTDCWDFVCALYDQFGPARLIWGSDFPHVLLKDGYRRNLLLPQRAFSFLSPADLNLIMGGNAARLYWD